MKRYEIMPSILSAEDGEWVRYEDAQAEIEGLRASRDQALVERDEALIEAGAVDDLKVKNAMLQAEIERLRNYLRALEPSDRHPGYIMPIENGLNTYAAVEAWLNEALEE